MGLSARSALLVAVAVGIGAAPAAAVVAPAQTVGMDYSGFSCPRDPTRVQAGSDATLVVETATNFSTETTLEVPALHVKANLPYTFSAVRTRVHLGTLQPGDITYRIVAPTTVDGYGASCQGTLHVV